MSTLYDPYDDEEFSTAEGCLVVALLLVLAALLFWMMGGFQIIGYLLEDPSPAASQENR